MNLPSIRRVTVAGAGVLGAQIAFQAAVHGFSLLSTTSTIALSRPDAAGWMG
jgi:3-hydroxyacyl-CoA dehydrogenase